MADFHDIDNEAKTDTAQRLDITTEGVYLDGRRLPAAGEVTVETAAPDFHIVRLTLCVKTVEAESRPRRVGKTEAAVYRYVHPAGEVTR